MAVCLGNCSSREVEALSPWKSDGVSATFVWPTWRGGNIEMLYCSAAVFLWRLSHRSFYFGTNIISADNRINVCQFFPLEGRRRSRVVLVRSAERSASLPPQFFSGAILSYHICLFGIVDVIWAVQKLNFHLFTDVS